MAELHFELVQLYIVGLLYDSLSKGIADPLNIYNKSDHTLFMIIGGK